MSKPNESGGKAHDDSGSSVVDLFHSAATAFGDAEFLRDESGSISFKQAWQQTTHLAGRLLKAGADPGVRVALMLPNGTQWPLLWLAALRAGAVTVPVNYAYQPSDLEFVLRDSGALLLITTDERMEMAQSAQPNCPNLTQVLDAAELFKDANLVYTDFEEVTLDAGSRANLQYTSGTTGFPKACILSHGYWVGMGRQIASEIHVVPNDVAMTAQPFSYIDPQWNVMLALTAGIPLVVLPKFSASGFWPAVRTHRVTFFYVLGTMPMLLFKQPPAPEDLNNQVRMVLCSGINRDLHHQFEERWGSPWREAYGLTETGIDLVAPLDADDLVGSGVIGYPVATKRVEIRDENDKPVPDQIVGEIVVTGTPMMDGYWNRPEESERVLVDGWFHTGDLGVREPEGWFRIVGRLKDMVRRGGENISASEVESVLGQHPDVLSVAVTPFPDELWGEEVKAFVQLRDGQTGTFSNARTLVEFAGLRIARFKLPRYVQFVEDFPMTPSERISKPKLLERTKRQPEEAFDMLQVRSSAAQEKAT